MDHSLCQAPGCATVAGGHGPADDVGRYWLNPNIVGSYAPSSIRGIPRKVIDSDGSEFILRPNHAQLARTYLLYNDTLSSLAFAALCLRRSFTMT